jgi:hypothetical protein
MANSSSVQPWSLTMPLGSLQQWTFTFTTVDQVTGQSEPYPITGFTWEYSARLNATDTGTPLIELTATAGSQGVLLVTATGALSQVEIEMYPAATQLLTPGTYTHALWSSPGSASAFCWFTGTLILQATPQP